MIKYLTSGITALLVIGFLVAVVRHFDGDVFAAFEWLFASFWSIVNKIADFFTGNEVFNEMLSSPA